MDSLKTMIEAYTKWHIQARKAIEKTSSVKIPAKSYRYIVVCGMGGSGIVGDYLSAIAYRDGNAPIFVIKDASLPHWLGEKDLIIAISYSGNTIETLECFRKAINRGADTIAITGGGELLRLSKEHRKPVILVEKGVAARATFPYLFYPALLILTNLGVLPEKESDLADESISVLEELAKTWKTTVNEYVSVIYGKIPVILSCCEYSPLAWRIKNEFNENSKVQAKVETLPEWGHNDVEGWSKPPFKDAYTVIAIDPLEKPASILLREAINILEEAGVRTIRLKLHGGNIISKLMYGTLLGGLLSIALAEKMRVNPLETPLIKEYRNRVARIFGN